MVENEGLKNAITEYGPVAVSFILGAALGIRNTRREISIFGNEVGDIRMSPLKTDPLLPFLGGSLTATITVGMKFAENHESFAIRNVDPKIISKILFVPELAVSFVSGFFFGVSIMRAASNIARKLNAGIEILKGSVAGKDVKNT